MLSDRCKTDVGWSGRNEGGVRLVLSEGLEASKGSVVSKGPDHLRDERWTLLYGRVLRGGTTSERITEDN